MTSNLYLLIPQSNLHAGAGSSNYGVIDNLVQRDAIDQFPNVHASSLKGALKEFFEESLEPKTDSKLIFGVEDAKGNCVFSEAHLLALPVRSNQKPYFMATSAYVLQKFLSISKEYGHTVDAGLEKDINDLKSLKPKNGESPVVINHSITNLRIEDFTEFTSTQLTFSKLNKIIGDKINIVLFSDDDFKYQCGDYALPVLARNHLDNGISKNLWYEQVVPRQACFYFFVDDYTDKNLFDESIKTNNKLVQVGGNATVGYGRCKITNLKQKLDESNK